jgi:hypothetical protein
VGRPRPRWEGNIMRDSLLLLNVKRSETSRGQEFLEVGSRRAHGPMRSVAPLTNNNNNNNNNNNGLAIELSRRCRNHFLHIIPPEINNTPYIAKHFFLRVRIP